MWMHVSPEFDELGFTTDDELSTFSMLELDNTMDEELAASDDVIPASEELSTTGEELLS